MRFAFSLILVSCLFTADCQESKSRLPVITLRTNPLSFLEDDAGPMLGIGVQVAPRWSFDIDPMLIFYSPYKTPSENKDEKTNINGYKLRASLKYFLRDYEYAGKPKLFFALEWHYKEVTEKKWETFGMNFSNNQYAFFQRGTYGEVRIENGGIFKTGFITKLWNPKWALEVYAGVGVKYTRLQQKNIPLGGEFLSDPNGQDIFTTSDGATPMMPIGAKFLFRIY